MRSLCEDPATSPPHCIVSWPTRVLPGRDWSLWTTLWTALGESLPGVYHITSCGFSGLKRGASDHRPCLCGALPPRARGGVIGSAEAPLPWPPAPKPPCGRGFGTTPAETLRCVVPKQKKEKNPLVANVVCYAPGVTEDKTTSAGAYGFDRPAGPALLSRTNTLSA